MRLGVVLAVLVLAMVAGSVESEAVELEKRDCVPTGDCTVCTRQQRRESYCQKTGRRQEVTCVMVPVSGGTTDDDRRPGMAPSGNSGDTNTAKFAGHSGGAQTNDDELMKQVFFEPCSYTAADNTVSVFWFQVFMATIGGIAMWGVYNRRKRTGRSYIR